MNGGSVILSSLIYDVSHRFERLVHPLIRQLSIKCGRKSIASIASCAPPLHQLPTSLRRLRYCIGAKRAPARSGRALFYASAIDSRTSLDAAEWASSIELQTWS